MKRILLAALCLASSGCVYTSYTSRDGAKLTRISLFGNQTVGRVDLGKGTLEGYSSEQAEVAQAVVSAAVRAAVKP